jgi:hypothetical protein
MQPQLTLPDRPGRIVEMLGEYVRPLLPSRTASSYGGGVRERALAQAPRARDYLLRDVSRGTGFRSSEFVGQVQAYRILGGAQ